MRMKSDCKSFQVFDFSAEDELAELASAKLLSKYTNPSAAVDKYSFLQSVAQGTNFQSKDMSSLPCVDVDGDENDQNCDNAFSRIHLGSDGENPVTKQAGGLSDFGLFNSVSDKHHPQVMLDEFKPGSFAVQLESRSSSPEAASPYNSSQLNCALQDSQSNDESVDVIPDADESMSADSASTSSHILEDEVALDGYEHGHGHVPSSGHCLGTWEMGNRNVAVLCPDYVVYRGRYCTESVLTFTSSCVELKGSTSDGNEGTFSFQWGIDDIVNIDSRWSERLRVAMVKLRLISKDEMHAKGGQGTSGIEELQFAAAELNWYKKQEEIMSLDMRYRAQWNVGSDSPHGIRLPDDNIATRIQALEGKKFFHRQIGWADCYYLMGGDGEALPGLNGIRIPKKSYLANFDEPFEEVVYPKGDSDAVTISKQDVDLLQPDTFVNDTIIDFYIKYLKNEIQPSERHRFHFFNSFFFRKLIDLDKDPSSAFEGRAAFQRVRKWTRKVNLFEKDYVFIPINFNYHWSLIVICHPGEVAKFQDEDMEKPLKVPCILHMDSIKGSHTGLKDLVQSYLWEEWKEKHKETCEDISSKFFNLRFVPLELPQQQNSFDCGLFLLHYVERFLKDAPLSFSPFKISKFSSFLNGDWFPAAEPSLKRVQIQNLICDILEKENSPAACSGNPCSSVSNYPASNSEIETGVELISERCSPSKRCRGKLSSSPEGDGIEITLLPSSSQCAGDSGLVLREFFEEGATTGSFLHGQFPTFDRAASFSEFNGVMSAMEEDVEAGGNFIYSQSDETATCVFPYSSGDFRAETSCNPGVHQSGEENIDPSLETGEENIDPSLETPVCASDDNSSEVEFQEDNTENPSTEEKIVQPISPLMENVERLTESLAAAPSEIFDVVDSQSSDHMLNSNGNVDHHISRPKVLPELDQKNGEITGGGVCLVVDNLVSETDGLEVSDGINGKLVIESVNETAAKRIGGDIMPESDELQPSKRHGDDIMPESDEQQPSKRLRLSNDLHL
ncbi:probable ubiquitin-like-specific protease 2B [Rhododendron vialii]|uniref:probable ubiquitin-like-specific protease 2B n=1 Tax=Rhododendron vialii TaxID=182163 RepID=UPI00265DB4CD|nr:probable ubiquitin-like-specific protease 2B [Rhododendron vialii]